MVVREPRDHPRAATALRWGVWTLTASMLTLPVGCDDARPGAGRETVVVFAAASTGAPLRAVIEDFEGETGAAVSLSLAGSAMLARQIMSGARADLYLGADPRWTEQLQRQGLVDPSTVVDLMGNELVLVTRRGNAVAVELTPGFDVASAFPHGIAMADAELAPAGRYTEQTLSALGWLERPGLRLIPAPDVRAALRLAELGEVDAAAVYASDAAGSDRVEVVARFDPATHDPIRYTAALCPGASPAARRLLERLAAGRGRAAFVAAGFSAGDAVQSQ